MTPIHHDDLLFIAGYSNKNLLLRLATDKPAAEVVWQDISKQAMSPVNVQPFLDGDTLYGFDQSGNFIAMELASGKRLWQTAKPLDERRAPRPGTAFIVRQADRYWLFTEQGDLVIA